MKRLSRVLIVALLLCSCLATKGFITTDSVSAQSSDETPSRDWTLGDPSALNGDTAARSSELETSCYGTPSGFKSGVAIAGWAVLDCVGSTSMYIEVSIAECSWVDDDWCYEPIILADMGPECSAVSGTLYCPVDGGLYFYDVYPEGCFAVMAFFEVDGDEGASDGSTITEPICW